MTLSPKVIKLKLQLFKLFRKNNIIPDAQEKRATYENFIAICPTCNFENIFNRVSDLNDRGLISHKQVVCQSINCAKPFNISGDSVSAAYEMLIYDCYELNRSKHYMYCILNLAQAYESFFSLYLRNELLYKPFSLEPNPNIEKLNSLSANLYNKTKEFTFCKMRDTFLHQLLQKTTITSLAQSEISIQNLPDKPTTPADKIIESNFDKELADLLIQLKKSNIHEIRNKVVHKYAYRPTLQEVDKEIKQTREILFLLAQKLEIKEF